MKSFNLKGRLLIITLVLLVSIRTDTGFSQRPINNTQATRALKFRELLGSIEGIGEEPARIFKTPEGYLRFIGAPPSTHFAVAPGTPEEAADAFLEQWRNLFVNVSAAVGFERTRVISRNGRSYVRYRQRYASLPIRSALVVYLPKDLIYELASIFNTIVPVRNDSV